ncbi:uncharacterized protein LOC103137571 isoform X1 [Poecilia formosa]|uniref:uncharacterized protein LOC103137571 isoform X1 n=1 Tax=Poecilia formosa TaxID=48698 RepID=UPI000443B23A|nr:PREDICTED: uncharacterized protein LOC103137571 isoform X1 [Poecilia formosa]
MPSQLVENSFLFSFFFQTGLSSYGKQTRAAHRRIPRLFLTGLERNLNYLSSQIWRKEVLSRQMAAPSAGRPVTVTVGTVWKLQLNPSPPAPIRLSVGTAITWTCLTVARVIFGVVYFRDCPQQPNIPNYLLGLALIALLMIPFVTLPCESYAAQPREHPRGFKACMAGFVVLFIFVWFLLGAVWVFSVYQPNYDPSAADGLYCNKTLYTFAFWNAVLETFGLGALLAKFCKGMLCYVNMSPVDRGFYDNV